MIEKINNNYIYGKTRSFKNVKIKTGKDKQNDNTYYHNKYLIGEFTKTQITKVDSWGLEGKKI